MKIIRKILKYIFYITIDVIILFSLKMIMPVDNTNTTKTNNNYNCQNQI